MCPGSPRAEEKDVPTAPPAGHSAPTLVVYRASYHEWIELSNGSGHRVDLGDWLLDDEPEAGAAAQQPWRARVRMSPGQGRS